MRANKITVFVLVLFGFVLPVVVLAQFGLKNPAILRGKPVVAESCSTAQETKDDADNGVQAIFQFGSGVWYASKFVVDGNYTACKVEIMLNSVGSPTGNLTAHIFSNDTANDQPNASLGSSDVVDASTVGGTAAYIEFTGLSVSLTGGLTNWVVLTKDSVNNGNHLEWTYMDTDESGNDFMRDDDAVAPWSLQNGTKLGKFILYSE